MVNVAILYVGIGQYIKFWQEFYLSMEKKFLLDSNKDYFVFTDAENIAFLDRYNVNTVYQEDLGWPGNTLYRYKMFYNIVDKLQKYDYIFFLNANIICTEEIKENDLFETGEDLIVVQHPGFIHAQPYQFPYERRKVSRAYIPYTQGNIYICGGINGGKSQEYIKMIEELAIRIEEDTKNNVIAVWHDESHINRYIMEHGNAKILPIQYAYPENSLKDQTIPKEVKLLLLDKKKYIVLPHNKEKRMIKSFLGINKVIKGIRDSYWKFYYSYFKR